MNEDVLKIGFGRKDITPRVGVELQGYGAYLCRHSDGIRDRLYARAVAFDRGDTRMVLASCDLAGVTDEIREIVRAEVGKATGLGRDCVMVHATHTHSGPATRVYSGWGEADAPYNEILPYKIARACIDAVEDLREATLSHAEVPCEGMGINREYDAFRADSVDDALRDDWRPAKPELTDTACHVFRVDDDAGMIGFFTYFGCHPVVGGPGNRKIHGDYAGVATNLVERLRPGTTGLFLQGCQGDVNTAATACDEGDTMRALDVLAARFARSIIEGLDKARPVDVDGIGCVIRAFAFTRKNRTRDGLAALLAEQEALLHTSDASDADGNVRQAMVKVNALRRLLAKMDRGEDPAPPTELQGLRIGPVALLGTPFEVQQAIRNDFLTRASSPIALVMGLTNGGLGYAVDRDVAARGGYAADLVPFICGQLPFANIHDELAAALVELDGALHEQGAK